MLKESKGTSRGLEEVGRSCRELDEFGRSRMRLEGLEKGLRALDEAGEYSV